MAEPEHAESSDLPSQPALDPTAETKALAETSSEAFAEQNRKLKRKLRHAVTVVNGCVRTLGRERAEVKGQKEERRKLEWALLIEQHISASKSIHAACLRDLPLLRFKSVWQRKRIRGRKRSA